MLQALVQAGAIESVRTTRMMRGQSRTYQDLQLSPFGRDVMVGTETTLCVVMPKTPATSKGFEADNGNVDDDLYARLKAVRRSLAQDQGVPPYVIAPNRTLEAMAAQRPTSEQALTEIHGMGSQRIARYGSAFLDTVRGWTESGSNVQPAS